ncbi:hypothetical protein C0J52_05726 [Blattella germanica]|nr:hypothetical protein C0J52_05726 [Blattella germanica]
MDYECKAESGLQLLARLSTRPELHGLEEKLFSDGLKLGDVVEISGDLGSGKTFLITQLLAKCLLPKMWNGIQIGGVGAGAIIVNTEHNFQLLKLVNLMESSLLKTSFAPQAGSSGETQNQDLVDSQTIEKIIKQALSNLTILNCYDRVQLLVTFHSLENILASNSKISLIVLDSLSAYYWQDIPLGGIRKMDLYLKKTLKTLQSCIKEHKTVIIFSKQTHFQSKINFASESGSKQSLGCITFRVTLNKMEMRDSKDLFFVEVCTINSKQVVQYKITTEGLEWIS